MNAITVSETTVESVESPEAEAIEIEAAQGVTYLLPETKQIPLSKLVPSPANVGRVNAAINVEELADSIEAHGLIQNLTVRKAKRGNKYKVVAGARRFGEGRDQGPEGRSRRTGGEGAYRKGMAPCSVALPRRGQERCG